MVSDRLTAFGAQPIGQRDERLSLIGFAPKALRLSNSIEPTPFGLRSARSVGTVNCIQASPDAISAPNQLRLISLPVVSHEINMSDQKLKITLDTNCINTRPNNQLDKLFYLQEEGKVQLYVPDGVLRDILKEEFDSLRITDLPSTPSGIAAKKRLAKIQTCSVIQGPLHCGDKVYGQVGGTCGGENITNLEGQIEKIINRKPDYQDIRILLLHISVGNDIFLTNNTKDFVKDNRRELFLEQFNICIKTPEEFLESFLKNS